MYHIIGKFITKEPIYRVIDTKDLEITDLTEDELINTIDENTIIENIKIVNNKIQQDEYKILETIGVIGAEQKVFVLIERDKNYYVLSDQEGNIIECDNKEFKEVLKQFKISNYITKDNNNTNKVKKQRVDKLKLVIFGLTKKKVQAQIKNTPSNKKYIIFEYNELEYEILLKRCNNSTENREYYHAYLEGYEVDNDLMDFMCNDWRVDEEPHLTIIIEYMKKIERFTKAFLLLNCNRLDVFEIKSEKDKEGIFNIKGLHATTGVTLEKYNINIDFNSEKVTYENIIK